MNSTDRTVGRKLVVDHVHTLVLPIINLPSGTKRVRIRQRPADFCRFFIKTSAGLEEFVGAYVDDESAIELISLGKRNLTRPHLPSPISDFQNA